MTTHEILHIIRNPWGWSEEEVRQARIAAADLIEQQAKRIAALERLAVDAYEAWNSSEDMRAGKLLRAMTDRDFMKTYRPDLVSAELLTGQ